MSEEDVMEFDDGMLPTLPVGHIRIDSQSEEYGFVRIIAIMLKLFTAVTPLIVFKQESYS
jgi:hypothetical protein